MDWWSQPYDPRWWGSLIFALALSAFVTWLSIRYAHSRDLVDLPGQRRSHTQPTPRGGGVGIVVAVLGLVWLAPLAATRDWRDFAFGGGLSLLLVALIGWIDDHRSLSARVRVLVQFVAALLVVFGPSYPLLQQAQVHGFLVANGSVAVFYGCLGLAATLAIVWSINLHNFMDGIDGLLAAQSIFVFLVLAMLVSSGWPHAGWGLAVACAGVLGFVPFNFPRARIFMGDVGSGALGFLIALAAWHLRSEFLLPVVIASSAFVVDASCTLFSRMLRGRRWYSAHREHLYQWMARAGMSHPRVVAWYMAWNLFLVVPVLLLASRGSFAGRRSLLLAVVVYVSGGALWIFGKRWCLHKVKSQHRHAAA